MYVGRIVAVARNKDGRLAVLYRVSSRSFPNREAQVKDASVAIVPKQGHEGDVFKNPYIAYNALRIVGKTAIATNGSQTDPISEKIASGVPIRDAFVASLLALDYEKDQYNTPRIASAVTRGEECGMLGVIREDGLEVRRVALQPGECCYVSTYETHHVSETQRGVFDATSAAEGAEFVLHGGVFAEMTLPVTGVCALETQDGFEIAAAQA
jgi:IMP cyclohydrolase